MTNSDPAFQPGSLPEDSNPTEMLLITYSVFVERLFKEDPTEQAIYMHAAAGISGEAGEIIDCVKKYWVYNKPLDKTNLIEELGDIFFYMQKIMNLNNWTIEDVLRFNIAKLEKRYPSGYSDAAAQARADKVS